jgi:outer membrane immunogenic protein
MVNPAWTSPMLRIASLCSFAVASLMSPCAQAADFDLQTTPSRPSADFSGVCLGVDAGVGLGSAGAGKASGTIGGAHIGYNFQASRLVGGAEADFLTSGIKSGNLSTTSFQQNFLSSMRVKTGWAFGDLLAYGTLGWGYSTSKFTDATGTSNKSIKGTAYGAGAEFAVTRNAFLRVEYLRYDFGAQTYVTPQGPSSLTTNTNLLRAGASVHF